MTPRQMLKREAQKQAWWVDRPHGPAHYVYYQPPRHRTLRNSRRSLGNDRWVVVIVVGFAAAVLWEVATGQAEHVIKSFTVQ